MLFPCLSLYVSLSLSLWAQHHTLSSSSAWSIWFLFYSLSEIQKFSSFHSQFPILQYPTFKNLLCSSSVVYADIYLFIFTLSGVSDYRHSRFSKTSFFRWFLAQHPHNNSYSNLICHLSLSSYILRLQTNCFFFFFFWVIFLMFHLPTFFI